MTPCTKILLAFGVVWFSLRLLDLWWPPHNPTLNGALALAVCVGLLANMIARRP